MDAFDSPSLAVIVVPAEEPTLVGVGFLFHGVVYDQNAIPFVLFGFFLKLVHRRLYQAPYSVRESISFSERKRVTLS